MRVHARCRPWLFTTLTLLFINWGSGKPAAEPIRPVPDSKGAATLADAIQRLPVVASMLHTGAHPDDERSSLMAYVSRGLHARAAYMALNRGEGGQNLIGPELYDGIGAIRTDELMAARQFDGAEQYFSRAFDFGYSKSADEAFELWGRDLLLSDMVRVIRRFRPDVIVSVFAGSPRDGHGQHQAAGITTKDAFRAAADPNQFPDQIAAGLQTWQASKLYLSNLRATFPSLDSLIIDTGDYSPIYQRSYNEIGLAGRSMHRSQDMGTIQRKGPATTRLKLVDREMGAVQDGPDKSLFDGIDTSFMRLCAVSDDASLNLVLRPLLSRLDGAANQAAEDFRPFDPTSVLPAAVAGLNVLRDVRGLVTDRNFDETDKDYMLFLLDLKERDFVDVISLALGLSFEVLADDPVVTPGETFTVELQLLNRSHVSIVPISMRLQTPETWTATSRSEFPGTLGYNEMLKVPVSVALMDAARSSKPYWRRTSNRAATVEVTSEDLIGYPWRPADAVGHAVFEVEGTRIEITRPAEYRYANRAIGEIRRPLMVAPALSVSLTPENAVIPSSADGQSRRFQVTVRNNVAAGARAIVRLEAAEGWVVEPAMYSFDFKRENEEMTLAFEVTPSPGTSSGTYLLSASAEVDGRLYTEGFHELNYPHIDPHHLYRDAVSDVTVIDVEVAPDLVVGYIMGAGDDIPASLEQLGVKPHLLDSDDLASADLSDYDVIVAGIRAYEVRPDLVSLNHRLMAYVRQGGTYIVQYNKYAFNQAQYGPYPAAIHRPHDRVTREDAPVVLLVPDHPIFNMPNRITQDDFQGWVQERGLYFWGEWDDRYTPLMASQDPGEDPKAGGLVEARYGEGRYIYTGYAWFRQLPAGVPGAFRIFANLLSLPKIESAQ